MLASAPILHHLLGRQSSADILDHILGKQKEEETFDQSSTMFHICQGSCFCAGEGRSKGKVLYCFGEMVIERSNLREEEKGSGSVEEQQMYYMQLAQLVIVVALILAVLSVLLCIHSGVSRVRRQVTRILDSLPDYQSWERPDRDAEFPGHSMPKKEHLRNGLKQPAENGDYRECLYVEGAERRHDTMSVLSEGS